jgi:hypothetical protein
VFRRSHPERHLSAVLARDQLQVLDRQAVLRLVAASFPNSVFQTAFGRRIQRQMPHGKFRRAKAKCSPTKVSHYLRPSPKITL